jgi:hypothetical protein
LTVRTNVSIEPCPPNHVIIANEKRQVASLEQANAYDHFLSDPYASKHPLSSKRIARFWDEKRLADLCQNQPPVVQRLLTWQEKEYFSGMAALPWYIAEQS